MSIYLENAARLSINIKDPKAVGIINMLIEHMKLQDERIARLEKLVDRHEGENSLNRPLI